VVEVKAVVVVAAKVAVLRAVVVVKAMVAAGLAAPAIHQAVVAAMHRQVVAKSNICPKCFA